MILVSKTKIMRADYFTKGYKVFEFWFFAFFHLLMSVLIFGFGLFCLLPIC